VIGGSRAHPRRSVILVAPPRAHALIRAVAALIGVCVHIDDFAFGLGSQFNFIMTRLGIHHAAPCGVRVHLAARAAAVDAPRERLFATTIGRFKEEIRGRVYIAAVPRKQHLKLGIGYACSQDLPEKREVSGDAAVGGSVVGRAIICARTFLRGVVSSGSAATAAGCGGAAGVGICDVGMSGVCL
jgi:hypothetical protein